MGSFELMTCHGNTLYYPPVEDGVTWETHRKGTPGKVSYTYVYDHANVCEEGDPVRIKDGDNKIFYGFVFSKKRDKNGLVQVTAYDQLRYFKNKDTYVYENKTAGELLQMLAGDFRLQTGTITNTGYKIASRVEEDTSLFDMMQNALDLTLQNTKRLYVLYDNFGKLCMRNIEELKLDLLIDAETGENFDYTSSIDQQTYNRIKLTFDNESTGKRDVYIAQHGENINQWGILQFFEKINENTNGQAKADALLELYNKKTRNLKIKNAFGDPRVHAGTSVVVMLDLGDYRVQNYMLVETATHRFSNNEHTMDLSLRGGEFIA